MKQLPGGQEAHRPCNVYPVCIHFCLLLFCLLLNTLVAGCTFTMSTKGAPFIPTLQSLLVLRDGINMTPTPIRPLHLLRSTRCSQALNLLRKEGYSAGLHHGINSRGLEEHDLKHAQCDYQPSYLGVSVRLQLPNF